MTDSKPMFLFYFSIILAIASSVLYHFVQKSTPEGVNFAVSLLVTYIVSIAITLVIFAFFPTEKGFFADVRGLNWASYALAFSLVGLEVGFLLVYRSGWNLGTAAILTNVVAALILVPIAIFIFKEKLDWINILGIVV